MSHHLKIKERSNFHSISTSYVNQCKSIKIYLIQFGKITLDFLKLTCQFHFPFSHGTGKYLNSLNEQFKVTYTDLSTK